jgi:hypothetical protein
MRRGLAGLVILAGAVALLALDLTDPDTPDGGPSRHGVDRGGPGSVEGTVEVVPGDPLRHSAGGIVGTVRRGSRPAAARIEVRRFGTSRLDDRDPRSGRCGDDVFSPPPAGSPVGTATAGEDGRFEVSGLDAGVYQIDAMAADGSRGWSAVEIRLAGQRVGATIALPERPVTLRGRAVWSDGRPYVGNLAVVPCLTEPDHVRAMGASSRVRTGEDGRFEVSGLETGKVSISVLHPGPVRAHSQGYRVPRDGELVFTVDAGFRRANGRVVDAVTDRPVPGAVILADTDDYGSRLAWENVLSKAVSDAEGASA